MNTYLHYSDFCIAASEFLCSLCSCPLQPLRVYPVEIEGYHIGGVVQERWVYPWVFHLYLWGVVWSNVSCDLWDWGYVNIARLTVQCLVSFINHKNALKDHFTLHISSQYWGSSKPAILLSLKQRQERSLVLDIDFSDFFHSFYKITYSLLSLWQPLVLPICNKLRASLSAEEHEFWGAGLLPLGFIGRKGLHRIYLLTPGQSRVRIFLFDLALHFASPCSIDVRLLLRHCHI